MKHWITSSIAALTTTVALVTPAAADEISDFYSSRQVTLIVGAGAGGGFGINGRILASHYGKYIPGNPHVVVQHKSGAGGGIAANYVYNAAAKDGSVIHMPVGAIVQSNLLHPDQTRYRSEKFLWIGSIADQPYELAVWHTAPAKTIEEARHVEVILGATGGRSEFYQIPRMMNELLGTKFKIITGYKGAHGVDLAMERGEVQGRAVSYASSVTRTPHWITEKKIIPLVQIGASPIPELTKRGVPRFIDLVKTEREKRMVEVSHTSMKLGRSVNAPPGVPMARIEALRKAFDETMKDPAFEAAIRQAKMPFAPTSGPEIQAFIERIMSTPPELVAEIAKMLEPPQRN